MHILIVGNSDINRAGFVDALLARLTPRPTLYGYRSTKEAEGPDGQAPIYIYPAQGPRQQSRQNLLGWCRARKAQVRPEAFAENAFLIEDAKPGGLLVMDEIGPMESRSPRFCDAVLAALDGDVPILATVRDHDIPFLRQVRSHPKARCFPLTNETAEALLPQVLEELRRQLP